VGHQNESPDILVHGYEQDNIFITFYSTVHITIRNL